MCWSGGEGAEGVAFPLKCFLPPDRGHPSEFVLANH